MLLLRVEQVTSLSSLVWVIITVVYWSMKIYLLLWFGEKLYFLWFDYKHFAPLVRFGHLQNTAQSQSEAALCSMGIDWIKGLTYLYVYFYNMWLKIFANSSKSTYIVQMINIQQAHRFKDTAKLALNSITSSANMPPKTKYYKQVRRIEFIRNLIYVILPLH